MAQTAATAKLTPAEEKEVEQVPKSRQAQVRNYLEHMTPTERVINQGFQDMQKLPRSEPQRISAWPAFVTSHTLFINAGNDGPANIAFGIRDFIKANRSKSLLLAARIQPIDAAFPPSSDLGKSLFESMTAASLLKNDTALGYALQLAQGSVALLHEDQYISWQREDHAQRQRAAAGDPLNVPEAFSLADATDSYHQQRASRYATLGAIQAKLGDSTAAEKSFTRSLSFHPDMSAYLGMAQIEEARGDKLAALPWLYKADLTGRLDHANILKMRAIYAATHSGSGRAQLAALLDQQYEAGFHNPIQPTPYQGDARRTLLAELFTGAGCVPCMSPDLAFDASLKRYHRQQLVLLVYHDNAPDLDPLSNWVTDQRDVYYGTQGSTPHVMLDGSEIGIIQGPPTHALAAYGALTRKIDSDLKSPAGAQLSVHATRQGSKVRVTVRGAIAKKLSPLVLHVDLLQTEVSDSGENGLRIQPMVVRATARRARKGSGFDVSGKTRFQQTYTFDLNKIQQANYSYYAYTVAQIEKRVHGLFQVSYREFSYKINPDKLAVAAFIQNNVNKRVLQAAYAPVAGASSN
ncbi:MAG: hypothetical protein ACRD1Y_05635 [Terriglobales bacterium]